MRLIQCCPQSSRCSFHYTLPDNCHWRLMASYGNSSLRTTLQREPKSNATWSASLRSPPPQRISTASAIRPITPSANGLSTILATAPAAVCAANSPEMAGIAEANPIVANGRTLLSVPPACLMTEEEGLFTTGFGGTLIFGGLMESGLALKKNGISLRVC